MTRRRQNPRGFALGAVLWVLTVGTVLGAAAALQGRSAYNATRNRINAERAYWIAEACVAVMREAIDRALVLSTQAGLQATWRSLDAKVAALAPEIPAPCQASLRAMGSAIDVNTASDALLQKYFVTGVGVATADSLTDAVIDWRDQDDAPRTSGAERSWYSTNKRPAPRNDVLASIQELSLVRGLAAQPDLLANLSVDRARICLTTAPAPVLAALPGFTDDAVAQMIADRAAGIWFRDLGALRSRVPLAAGDSILVHFQELAMITTVEPEGWILTVSASAGLPAVAVTSQLHLDRYSDRALVLRRRTQ